MLFNFVLALPIDHQRVLSPVLTIDQYAGAVVQKYRITPGVGPPSHRAAEALIPGLKRWSGRQLLGITLSGAYAKGTAISLSSHVDVLLSLRPSTSARRAALRPACGQRLHGAAFSFAPPDASGDPRPCESGECRFRQSECGAEEDHHASRAQSARRRRLEKDYVVRMVSRGPIATRPT
jgi:hypothetical protein